MHTTLLTPKKGCASAIKRINENRTSLGKWKKAARVIVIVEQRGYRKKRAIGQVNRVKYGNVIRL